MAKEITKDPRQQKEEGNEGQKRGPGEADKAKQSPKNQGDKTGALKN
jgi:hypothetical protein